MNLLQSSRSTIWQRGWHQLRTKGIYTVLSTGWSYFWLRFSSLGYYGRVATWLATWLAPPYKMRRSWARYYAAGYIAPSARVAHRNLNLGKHIFIGDRVEIVGESAQEAVELGEGVYLHNDTWVRTGVGGSLKIGADTHIQPRCQFIACGAAIEIGSGVQIASNCSFHTSDRAISGDIVIEDDVWLGHGATILGGIRIGKGAVIGSGAVVEQNIPDGAIAVGIPARAIGRRSGS